MADDFSEYESERELASRRYFFIGGPGIGKTTALLDSCPRPLVYSMDNGLSQFPRARYYAVEPKKLLTWHSFLNEVRKVRDRAALPPGVGSIGFDHVGNIERLVHDYICERDHNLSLKPPRPTWLNGKANVPGYGYGGKDGYVAAVAEMREFLSLCEAIQRKHDVNIVLLGHSANHKVKDAARNDYAVIESDVEPLFHGALAGWSDVIIYIDEPRTTLSTDDRSKRDKTVVTSDERVGYTSSLGGAQRAKNRASLDPEIRNFSWHALQALMEANSPTAALPKQTKIRALAARRRDPEVLGDLTRAGTSATRLDALLAKLQAHATEVAAPLRAQIEAALAGEADPDKAKAVRAWMANLDEGSHLYRWFEKRGVAVQAAEGSALQAWLKEQGVVAQAAPAPTARAGEASAA